MLRKERDLIRLFFGSRFDCNTSCFSFVFFKSFKYHFCSFSSPCGSTETFIAGDWFSHGGDALSSSPFSSFSILKTVLIECSLLLVDSCLLPFLCLFFLKPLLHFLLEYALFLLLFLAIIYPANIGSIAAETAHENAPEMASLQVLFQRLGILIGAFCMGFISQKIWHPIRIFHDCGHCLSFALCAVGVKWYFREQTVTKIIRFSDTLFILFIMFHEGAYSCRWLAHQ